MYKIKHKKPTFLNLTQLKTTERQFDFVFHFHFSKRAKLTTGQGILLLITHDPQRPSARIVVNSSGAFYRSTSNFEYFLLKMQRLPTSRGTEMLVPLRNLMLHLVGNYSNRFSPIKLSPITLQLANFSRFAAARAPTTPNQLSSEIKQQGFDLVARLSYFQSRFRDLKFSLTSRN